MGIGIEKHRGGLVFAVTFFLLTSVVGCTPAAEKTDEEAGYAGATTTSEIAPAADRSTRDLETFDVCARISAADVAAVLEVQTREGSATPTMGRFNSDCAYAFQRDDGFSDHALVFVYPPQLWMPELPEDAEEVSGLGDEAFLTGLGGSLVKMNVLVEGDIYIDTRAQSAEETRRLAELALARLVNN